MWVLTKCGPPQMDPHMDPQMDPQMDPLKYKEKILKKLLNCVPNINAPAPKCMLKTLNK